MPANPQPPRGRGAASNPHNRFAPTVSEAWDDGWFQEVPPCRATEVRREQAKSVITRNRSPDVGFDRSVNPYHGCEHGCIYSALMQNRYLSHTSHCACASTDFSCIILPLFEKRLRLISRYG